MAEINELITKFSFVGSLKPQEGFNKNLKTSIGLTAGLAVAIQGATSLFVAWTLNVTKAIDPMVQLSRETDVAVGSMQELGFAASQNGSDLNATMSSIKELTKRAGEFARTGGGPAAEAFLQLGIKVRDANGKMKSADKIMMDMRGSLQSFNKAEQADILDKLGIDRSMIQLLNKSSKEIDALRAKARALGTVTEEQADAAAALNDANTVLKFGMQGLKNQIAVGIAPTIKELTEGFTDFLVANKDLIQNGIKALGKVLISASGFVSRMTPIALAAAAAFGVWKVATIGLGATLATVFSPVVLITAGIAAAALAIDDLIVAFKGGNSAIRNFIMDWTGFDIAPALQNGVKAIKVFIKQAIGLFDELKVFVSELFGSISETITGAFKAVGDAAASVGDFLGFSGGNDGAVDRGVTNNSSSTANVNQNNNINVYSNDPAAAGQAVANQQSQQLREARQYFNRGGM